MNHALLMRVLDGLGGGFDQARGVGGGGPKPVGADPVDVLHRDEGGNLAHFVHRRDVRMRQAGRHARLAAEARVVLVARGERRGGHELERHVAMKRHVPREPHGAEPAAAQLPDPHVMADPVFEVGGCLRRVFGHRRELLQQAFQLRRVAEAKLAQRVERGRPSAKRGAGGRIVQRAPRSGERDEVVHLRNCSLRRR